MCDDHGDGYNPVALTGYYAREVQADAARPATSKKPATGRREPVRRAEPTVTFAYLRWAQASAGPAFCGATATGWSGPLPQPRR